MNVLENAVFEGSQVKRPDTAPRPWLPVSLLLIVATVVLVRSFWLQVVQGEDFRERAEHNRVLTIVSEAPRGIIYDRNNIPLVSNISATDIVFDPRSLPSRQEETPLIDMLLKLLPTLDPEELQEKLEQSRTTGQQVPIVRSLDHETVLLLQENNDLLVGTQLTSSLVRNYENGYAFAHILGYTSLVSADDLENDSSLLLTEKIGRQGIESVYNESLRGKAGIAYQETDAAGQILQQLGVNDPVPGSDIQLTVDAEMQNFIYSVFSERKQKLGEEKVTTGSVIALDPRTGEVLAAVNFPSYNPNAFSQPSLQNEISSYISDPDRPLFNRFADGTYPSGSTIKPFLAAAALQEHLITPSTTILSTGGISVGPWNFPDWKAGGHGVTDVSKAIADSVNTFFYAISGGYEDQQGLGVKKMTEYLHGFGWGEATGIDLPSEASGFLPTPEWKEEVKQEPWYIGDTYHFGIGQGDVLVTPLQLAVSTAGIADGYNLRKPYFVEQSPKQSNIPIDFNNISTVREGMRTTVTDGSGRSLSALPIAIAGKTGTAQIGGTDNTHAWFTSFAPYDDPQVVITVLLEQGGEGDKDAVPFAKEIWQWWAENRWEGAASVNEE